MNRDEALRFVLRWEAGWYAGDQPRDPNPTNRGITLRTLKGLGSAGDLDGDGDTDVDDLRHLTEAQARAIYAGIYWIPAGCDRIAKLAPCLAAAVFDAAVQHGVDQAVRLLQRATYAQVVDGLYGRLTESAIAACLTSLDDRALTARFLAFRVQFYRDLIANHPEKAANEKGWRNRMNDLACALRMSNVWAA